jgi:hypothetical protein
MWRMNRPERSRKGLTKTARSLAKPWERVDKAHARGGINLDASREPTMRKNASTVADR